MNAHAAQVEHERPAASTPATQLLLERVRAGEVELAVERDHGGAVRRPWWRAQAAHAGEA